jgi:YcxB-like protein
MMLEYRLTRADLSEGLNLHNPGRGAWMVLGILACVTLIALGTALSWVRVAPPAESDLRRWSTVSLWLGVALLSMILTQVWTLRRTLSRRADGEETTRVHVDAGGLQAEARGVRSAIEWSRFQRFSEGRGHFVLYHTPEQYFIVPKRAFVSPRDIDSFRGLIQDAVDRRQPGSLQETPGVR